ILASLDRGSRAYKIFTDTGRFRFMGVDGEAVIRSYGRRKPISIPSRQAANEGKGFIRPTAQYIEEQIKYLKERAEVQFKEVHDAKRARLERFKARYYQRQLE